MYVRNGFFVLSALAVANAPVLTAPAVAQGDTWYLRGELGAAILDGGLGNWLPPGNSDPRVFHRVSKPHTTLGGLALGYRPMRGVRTELSYLHLFKTSVAGQWVFTEPLTPGPHADMATQVSSHLFFANAYFEPFAAFGLDWAVQPFVGGGAGLALNRMAPWTRTNSAAPDPVRTFEEGYNAGFAWNVAAGVSVPLARWLSLPLTLDLTYRYIDAGRVQGGRGQYPDLQGSVPRQAFNMPVKAHTWTVGLASTIGDPLTASGFGLARGGNFALPQARVGNPYVAACTSLGSRFLQLPGTDTCLSVQGEVRAEYGYIQPLAPAEDSSGFSAREQVGLDARTPTAYGPLQTFLRLELYGGSGVFKSADLYTAKLDRAFIRFGGVLAGRAPSMFDFYANALNFSYIGGSEALTTQLSYATDLGGGYRFGLGVESQGDRARPTLSDYFSTRRPPTSNIIFADRIEQAPNIVSALRYDGEGLLSAAQLSASLHEVRVARIDPQNREAAEWGVALQAGTKLDLPMFATGDALWLQAAYSEGSLSHLGATGIPTTLGLLDLQQSDAVVIQGEVKLMKGYALTAAFLHNWTGTVSQAVYGSLVSLDYPGLAPEAAGYRDTRVYQVGSNLVWTPVAGLQVGAEVLYSRVDPEGSVLQSNGVMKSHLGQTSVRLRMVRGF